MKTHRLAFLLTFIFLAGCASKDFAEPGVTSVSKRSTSKTFRGSYSDVWGASVAILNQQKFPLATSQKESGVILTDWIRGKSDRLYSGFGDTRIPYNIRYKFSMRFKPSRNGVKVSIMNSEQYMSDSITAGTDFSGSLYKWIPTDTSTLKENALLKDIEKRLSKRQGRSKGSNR